MKIKTEVIKPSDKTKGNKIFKWAVKNFEVGSRFEKDSIIIAQLIRLDAKTYTTDYFFEKVGKAHKLDVERIVM